MKFAIKCLILFVSVVTAVGFTLEVTDMISLAQKDNAVFLLLLWPAAHFLYLFRKAGIIGTWLVFTWGLIGSGAICVLFTLLAFPFELGSQEFRTLVATVGQHSFMFGVLSVFLGAILGSIFNGKIGLLPKK